MFKTALKDDWKALKTCIRHDITAVKRPVGFMLLLLAVSGLMLGLCMFGFTHTSSLLQSNANGLVGIAMLLIIGLITSFLGLFIGISASIYLGYRHMYQSFFTDQGYLTFTLPVKRSVLYLSKIVTLAIIELAAIIIFVISILWVSFLVSVGEGESIFNAGMSIEISGFVMDAKTAGGWLVLWVPLIILLVAVSSIASTGLLSLCMVITCVKNGKHKVWKGIGIFYLVSLIMGVASPLPLAFVGIAATEAWDAAVRAGGLAMGVTVAAILLAASMVIGCCGAIFHYIAIGKLERQLNLS